MINFEPVTTLIIAPHPDDEVFGCGGLIHRLKRENGKVYVLFMTVGTTADFSSKGESTEQQRLEEIEQVSNLLNFDGYKIAFQGDKYHLKLDAVPQKELVHAIERGDEISLESLKPDIVLTPSSCDYNQDHRATSDATITAVRPGIPGQKSFQPVVLTYELPYHGWNLSESSTSPDLLVKLEESDIEAKISALKLYKSQLKSSPSPLSLHGVKTHAAYYGLQCGVAAAEAFRVKRIVW